MTVAQKLVIWDVLHFDDEVSKVSMFADELYNYFMNRRAHWIDEEETVDGRWTEAFTLHPPGDISYHIRYKLFPDVELCSKELSGSNCDTNQIIAIFDLMKEDQERGRLLPVGQDLYQTALKRGISSDRLFVLSAFPDQLERYLPPAIRIPPDQLFAKPVAAKDIVVRIVGILPEVIRVE